MIIAIAVAALILFAAVVILLQRSAEASTFPAANDEADPAGPETLPAPSPDAPLSAADSRANSSLRRVFRAALQLTQRAANGDRYSLPLALLIGGEGSRDPKLLSSSGLDLPFGSAADAGMSLDEGRGFWFFDGGVVLDVAGAHLLRTDGVTSDERGWREILTRLQAHRPERPVDNVIVTVSAAELVAATLGDLAMADLSARYGRIYRKLADAQRQLGFQLPTYVIITGCEHLTGFASLCTTLPKSVRHEMLGWSNPTSLESVYQSRFATDAIESVRTRLDELQLEAFARGTPHSDTLLQLPSSVDSLTAPLRSVLDQLFRSSAYHGTLLLRGVYFCGREDDAVDTHPFAAPAIEHTAFLADVISEKVFAESGLAAPTVRTLLTRNRTLRYLQLSTVLAAIFVAVSLALGKHTLDVKNDELRFLAPSLVVMHRIEGAVGTRTALLDSELQLAAEHLLGGMARAGVGTYRTFWLPASYFSPLETHLEEALAHAFRDIILKAVGAKLHEKARNIIAEVSLTGPSSLVPAPSLAPAPTPSPATPPADTVAPGAGAKYLQMSLPPSSFGATPQMTQQQLMPRFPQVAPQQQEQQFQALPLPVFGTSSEISAEMSSPDVPVQTLESMSEFQRLARFVSDLAELEDNAERVQRLSRSGQGDLRELGKVVEYAFNYHMPERVYDRSELYEDALRRAQFDFVFDRSQYRVDATSRANALADNLYEHLFRSNAFAIKLQILALELDGVATSWPGPGETAQFQNVVTRMNALETALSGPQLEWAFRSSFDLGPTFDGVLAQIGRSEFLGPSVQNDIRYRGMTGFALLRRALRSTSSTLTGPLLLLHDGGADAQQLSPNALLLKSAFESLLGQPFVASARERASIRYDGSMHLVWNAALLDQANNVAQAYGRFREKELVRFPERIRATVDQVAVARARADMLSLAGSAESYEHVSTSTTAAMREDAIRNDVAAFTTGAPAVNAVMESFGRIGATDGQRAVATAQAIEGARLLRELGQLLVEDGPYRPREGDFSWWKGQASPSPAAWGASDPAEVAGYVDATRGRVASLAHNYAEPLLTWLMHSGMRDRAEVRQPAMAWQGILDDLRDYEAKRPGNSVAVLEDYITVRMPKVTPGDCALAAFPAAIRSSRGFFASSLQQLAHDLSAQCYALAGDSAGARYKELARYFNQRLAGRFPFSDHAPLARDSEAEAEDLRGFFRIFDQTQAVIRSARTEGDPSMTSARTFVEQMSSVREFFAPFLDAQKPALAPSYDLEPAFRVMRERELDGDQIIDWSVTSGETTVTSRDNGKKLRWSAGQPLRFSLRWANDAPRVPVAPAIAGAAVHGRTITFEYTNAWSLLTALEALRAPAEELTAYSDLDPLTLSFAVYTKPVAGGRTSEVPTQVYMRLSLLAPGTTTALKIPHFPARAPKLDAPAKGETP
jgi:type VI secretion system protein ImpL